MGIQPSLTPDVTLADATRLVPEAVTVFEQTEIDYSCQGARLLSDAAKDAGYRVEDILDRLETARRSGKAPTNWFDEPLPALTRYLTEDHRDTVGERIPALRTEIDDAVDAIGEVEELQRIRVLFGHLSTALSSHVLNEERELFPFINALHAASTDLLGAPRMRISQRVLRELVEHESFRDRLHTLRHLVERLPKNAAVKALQEDLEAFSNEVCRHMHLENNVLYPRAIEVENGLRRAATA